MRSVLDACYGELMILPVFMDQYTRRIIGFGVHARVVDGIALCRGDSRLASDAEVGPEAIHCFSS